MQDNYKRWLGNNVEGSDLVNPAFSVEPEENHT
jgi:hypothetical protein